MSKEHLYDVVVIGGGPAGMMSAGRASERGRSVLLLEKNQHLGKKLLISGGGRCNVTNNKPRMRTMLACYKRDGKFLFSAFSQFGVAETLKFFHDRGMDTKVENEDRVFPTSDKSQSVLDVLTTYMKDGGVEVKTKAEVTSILYNKEKGYIEIHIEGMEEVIHAKKCILATGGTSHPETGSTGEGFSWLQKLGHKVIENDFALVPILLRDTWVRDVAGVKLDNIKLTTFKDGVKKKVYKGKLLFTHVGISGPTVLNMSRDVGELLGNDEGSTYAPTTKEKRTKKKDGVTIVLDLFPTLDTGAVREKLQTLLQENINKKIKNSLSPLIPTSLGGLILQLAHIDEETPNNNLRSDERTHIVGLLKALPMSVKGLHGKEKAVISSGGVALEEVDFKTMQSRLIPELYLVGDALNIDRPSGGYSLQLCWTTGYVAGSNC